ncbi:MAG: translocation/assembly module TamB domain-containing protein [Candidatus Tectomicrobia bacterium]|uniref:Translocation/assembly module TamB domain-containing protein n=1 Tax=Tectimicrobiota bacterium TaxID=2528274 RepID=A0A932CQV1_UNCTE|nr:translocation/assembly module TamB domain-containing protein [Candidatus Tectomicrobia bacterium]
MDELSALFPGRPKLSLAGLIKANLTLQGKGLRPETARGEGKLEIDPLWVVVEKLPGQDRSGPHKLPLQATITYSLEGSRVTLKRIDVKGSGLEVKGRGRVDIRKGLMALKIESRLLPERYRQILPFPLAGTISFKGDIGGRWDKPFIHGQVEAQNLAVKRYPEISSLKADFSWKDHTLSLRQGTVRSEKALLSLKGDILFPGKGRGWSLWGPGKDRLGFKDLQFSLTGFRMESLRDWAAAGLPCSGEATVQGVLDGRDGQWHGQARLEWGAGTIWQQRFRSLQAAVELHPEGLSLEDFTLFLETGRLKGKGTYSSNDTFTAEVTGSGVTLADIDLVRARAPSLTGGVRVNIRGGGRVQAPRIVGDIRLVDLRHGGLPLGEGFLHAEWKEGVLQVRGVPLEGINLSGQVGMRAGLPLTLAFDLRRFSLVPPLSLWKKEWIAQGVTGWVSGSGRVQGPLSAPQELEGEVRLAQVEIGLDGYPLKNRSPVRISWQKGAFLLDEAALRVGEAEISVAGEIPLSGRQVIHIAGEVALPMLDKYLPAIRILQGMARADLEVVNDNRGLNFQGKIGISGGAIEIPQVNQGFSEVNGEISLEDQRIQILSLTARRGRGSLDIRGSLEQEKGRLTFLDLTLQGKGLRWQYPEGFSTYSDFLLYLKGKASQPLLLGQVELSRSQYVKGLDIKEWLLRFRREEGSAPFRLSDRLDWLLDLDLSTRDRLVFRNNLADLGLKARLRLTGSLKRPVLLGRADLENGEFRYLDRKFRLTLGRVEFIDPHRLRPYYEFEAQGKVDQYQIKMVSYGTLPQFNLNLYSDPPLSRVDILSLLLVGKTSTEAKGGAAYSMIANRVSQELAKGIQGITELDALEINAILEESKGEKGIEIMAKKALGEDITFTYRSDTTTNSNEQVIEMEYRLTDHISLVGKNSKNGSGGAEIKFNLSWD